MRTLLYVPIIHTSADLGSLAQAVQKRGIANLGEDAWMEHLKTIDGFWDAIAGYFDSIDVSGTKIYQDGLVADGEIGEKIVEEGIRLGSKNYELVSRLLQRGAILIKTEDVKLVKAEHEHLTAMTKEQSRTRKLLAFGKYKLVKDRLLNQRDAYIAKRIDETLDNGEKGILFIGAYHNVKSKLPADIHIIEMKNTEKVRKYQALIPFIETNQNELSELSAYLVSKARVDDQDGIQALKRVVSRPSRRP